MISAIIGALVEVGKWLADKAVTIGLVIYHATRIVGVALFKFGHAVAGVFGKVWDVFSKFYARVLKPFVEWSWRNIVKFHAWLKDTLGPVLKFLNQVRDDILRIYERWLRPILDTIDVLRQTVRLLELFHVPFAQKIDDALAALERRLLAPIRLALEKINELTNWVNRIIDFNGYFQRLTLVASAWRYERDMWSNWWGSVHRREQEHPSGPAKWPAPTTAKDVSGSVVAYAENRAGDHAAAIGELAQDILLDARQGVRVLA